MFVADLVKLITDAGLGVYGTTLFASSNAIIPAGPGPYITIIETGGASPEGTHNSPNVPAYERPSAQIVVRAEDWDDARARAQQLWLLLYPVRNRTVNGTWWRQVTLLQNPFDLQPDDKGRARVAFNFDCVKRV